VPERPNPSTPWPDLLRPRSSDRLHELLGITLLVVFALVLAFTWNDSGPRFDENNHLIYGDSLWRYYATGLRRFTRVLDTPYSGGFDLVGKAFRVCLPNLTAYEAIHLFGGIVAFVGLIGAWKLGRLLMGPRGAFWTLLLLGVTPQYYAHAFNNPKDVPFAVGYVWALYFLFSVVARFPDAPRRLWLWLGVSIGASLSVRIAALLLLGYVMMAGAAFVGRTWLARRDWSVAWHQTRRIGVGTAIAFATAWGLMLLSWPWAMRAPFIRPFKALAIMANYSANNGLMRFDGELVRFAEAPRTYLPRYFAYQLPELLVVLMIPAFGLVAWLVVRRIRSLRHTRQTIVLAILLLATVFPPLYAVYKQSTLYEGMRHFLFVMPPLCAAVALLILRVGDWLNARSPHLGKAWIAALALGCAVPAHAMVRLHPHQVAYFNSLTGGLEGAVDRYDTSVPGAYREAFERLAEHLWRTEPEIYANTLYQIGGCYDSTAARSELPPNFEVVGYRPPDFWVAYTANECHRIHSDSPEILRVERDGGLIVVVRDVRDHARMQSDAPWRASYYLNTRLHGTAVVYRAWDVNFDWGGGSPGKGVPADEFSATFDTCVRIDEATTARFALTANNGVRMAIDGEPVLDNWRTPATSRKVVEVGLEPGWHHLRVDYVEQRRNAGLWLQAGFAGGALVSLPSRMLSFPSDDPAQPCPSRSPAP
jgi:hypothetical protein